MNERKETLKTEKIVHGLTGLFLIFWILSAWIWINHVHPSPIGLLLALLSLLLFCGCVLRYSSALLVFWKAPRTFDPPQNRKEKKKLFWLGVLIGAIGLLWIDGALLFVCHQRFPELPWNEALPLFFKSITLDAVHYLNLAENGYAAAGPDRFLIVFFPLYPMLIRIGMGVVADSFAVGFWLNQGLTLLNAGLFALLAKQELNKQRSWFAVVLLLAFPGFFFNAFPMSEALFLFCTLMTFLLIRKECWIGGSFFAFLAALSRSSGVLLSIFLAIEVIQRELHHDSNWRKRLSICAPILGLVLYFVLNQQVSGNPFQFLIYQKEHWYQQLSYFFNTVNYQWNYLLYYFQSGQFQLAWGLMIPGMLSLFFTLILLFLGAGRIRISILGYSLAYFTMTMGATWLLSAPRYNAVLPSLPLILASLGQTEKQRWGIFALLLMASVIFYTFFLNGYPIY